MIKIQINKIANTCVIIDSVVYEPMKSEGITDFYEIPCELSKKFNMQIIHYSGDCKIGIYSVINYKDKNKYRSLINEIRSLDINLYYCQLNINVVVNKNNSKLFVNVENICSKDIIGSSTYCKLKIVQKINMQIDILNIQYYPSKKVKLMVFFIEILFQLLGIVVCFVGVIIAGKYTVERWYTPEFGMSYFLQIVPLDIFFLIMLILELYRVAKHTLMIK